MEKINKWAFVTGAASGIGKAITEHLADMGWGVYAADIVRKGLSHLAHNSKIMPLELDVTSDAHVKKAVRRISEHRIKLTALVNNAGVFFPGPLMDFSQLRFERQFAINLFGAQRITKALFPFLMESRGRIVNISSVAGFVATPFSGAYAASKHAIEGWSDSLRRELKPLGIDVVIIEPGLIKTALWQIDGNERLEHFNESILYGAYRKKLEHEMGMVSEIGIDPSVVAKTVGKALIASNPKPRYLVTENQLQYKLVKFLKLVSDRTLDKIIIKKL